MSMYSNNPDYPTNVGSFSQHTNFGQQTGAGFFYGGMGYGTQMMPDNSARRADGLMPQQPMQQPYGYGYTQPGYGYQQPNTIPPQAQIPTGVGQMLAAPEQGVQPFSSYPPNNGTPGFNQFMTDARRADAGQSTVVGANPWAQNQPNMAAPVNPQMGTMPNPAIAQMMMPNGYPGQGYSDAQALYQYGNMMGNNPFERRPGMNMWDNMYTTPQPYIPQNQPMWTQTPTQPQQPAMYQFPTGGVPNMAPPIPQAPAPSWEELSKSSFK